MAPKVFGYQHILYILITVAMTVGAVIFIKKKCKTERSLSLATRISGAVILAAIIANRVSIAAYRGDAMRLIPDTICGVTSFFFGLVLIFGRKNNAALQFVAFLAVVTGILSVAYPDYIGQADSFFYPPTVTGLLHHSLQIYCSAMVLATGYLKLTIKRWPAMLIGLCAYMTYGVLLMDTLGMNTPMQINDPLIEGTILTWYFVGPLILILYTAVLLIIDRVTEPPENRFLTRALNKLKRKPTEN